MCPGSMTPALISVTFGNLRGASKDCPIQKAMQDRVGLNWKATETQLTRFPYLDGDGFTVADCISVFVLTTFRLFTPLSLVEYPSIVNYLEWIGKREDYKCAMTKGGPDLVPVLSAILPTAEKDIFLCAGYVLGIFLFLSSRTTTVQCRSFCFPFKGDERWGKSLKGPKVR